MAPMFRMANRLHPVSVGRSFGKQRFSLAMIALRNLEEGVGNAKMKTTELVIYRLSCFKVLSTDQSDCASSSDGEGYVKEVRGPSQQG